MSPRRTTIPLTRVASRSSQSGRSEMSARSKTEKQSAKKRTVLDNRFHRTDLTLSCAARARVPKPERDAVTLAMRQPAGRRDEAGCVSFSVKFGRDAGRMISL